MDQSPKEQDHPPGPINESGSAESSPVAGKLPKPSITLWPEIFWHWVGKRWRWDAIFSTGAAGMIRFGEYAVGLALLFFAAFGAVSKIWHWGGSKTNPKLTIPVKGLGYIAVLAGLVFIGTVVIKIKKQDPWSHLLAEAKDQPVSPPNLASVIVGLGENTRFPVVPFKFKTVSDLSQIIPALIPSLPRHIARLRSHQNKTVVNVIVRNVSSIIAKNVRVQVISNVPIQGKTMGAYPFDAKQLSYQLPTIMPFSRLGEEEFMSVEVNTKGCETLFAPLITIDGDNIEPYAGAALVEFQQDKPCEITHGTPQRE